LTIRERRSKRSNWKCRNKREVSGHPNETAFVVRR